jgi:predicted nucleic acid-binding protein
MGLRSLDALHLASAMSLGDDLDGVITYDHRMLAAARELGLHTISPA